NILIDSNQSKYMSDTKIQTILRILVWSISGVMIMTIALAWIFYPEPYHFFQDTISSLGGHLSLNGLDNQNSSLIFTIGITICSGIAFSIAIIYFIEKDLFFNIGKAIIALFIALGAAEIAIPRDHGNLILIHGIGAAIFIISFGLFNGVSQLLRYSHKYHPKKPEEKKTLDFYLDLSMVYLCGLAIILYMVIFILHITLNLDILGHGHALGQKIVLITAGLTVLFLDKDDM
ncbi:MAG: hypothetical protein ACTSW5_05620, partial [Promethearchaeota archaeon]